MCQATQATALMSVMLAIMQGSLLLPMLLQVLLLQSWVSHQTQQSALQDLPALNTQQT